MGEGGGGGGGELNVNNVLPIVVDCGVRLQDKVVETSVPNMISVVTTTAVADHNRYEPLKVPMIKS